MGTGWGTGKGSFPQRKISVVLFCFCFMNSPNSNILCRWGDIQVGMSWGEERGQGWTNIEKSFEDRREGSETLRRTVSSLGVSVGLKHKGDGTVSSRRLTANSREWKGRRSRSQLSAQVVTRPSWAVLPSAS